MFKSIGNWLMQAWRWFFGQRKNSSSFTRRSLNVFRRPVIKPALVMPKLQVRPDQMAPAWVPNVPNVSFAHEGADNLKLIGEKATMALFRHLGCPWIPGVFRDFLNEYPDPVDALHYFCRRYGLSVFGLRRRQASDLRAFWDRLGLLLEIDDLGRQVGPACKQHMERLIAAGEFLEAEQSLSTVRLLLAIIRSAEQQEGIIFFKAFAEFLGHLRQLQVDAHLVTAVDAEEARVILAGFREWHDETINLLGHMYDKMAWLTWAWPSNTKWGRDNYGVLIGVAAEAETIESDMRQTTVFDLGPWLEQLAGLVATLTKLMAKVQELIDDHRQYNTSSTATDRMQNWQAALRVFGFSDQYNPGADEIKKTYRRLAMQCHPDRFAQKSQVIRDQKNKAFQELNAAHDVLLEGKPQTTHR